MSKLTNRFIPGEKLQIFVHSGLPIEGEITDVGDDFICVIKPDGTNVTIEKHALISTVRDSHEASDRRKSHQSKEDKRYS